MGRPKTGNPKGRWQRRTTLLPCHISKQLTPGDRKRMAELAMPQRNDPVWLRPVLILVLYGFTYREAAPMVGVTLDDVEAWFRTPTNRKRWEQVTGIATKYAVRRLLDIAWEHAAKGSQWHFQFVAAALADAWLKRVSHTRRECEAVNGGLPFGPINSFALYLAIRGASGNGDGSGQNTLPEPLPAFELPMTDESNEASEVAS